MTNDRTKDDQPIRPHDARDDFDADDYGNDDLDKDEDVGWGVNVVRR